MKSKSKDVPLDEVEWHRVDLNDVNQYLGRYGRYQMKQLMLICISWYGCSMSILNGIFTGKFVDFQCSEEGISNQSQTLLTNYTVVTSSCYVDTVDNNSSTIISHSECNQFDYEGNGTILTYLMEWDLVCDKEVLGQLPQIFLMIGTATGSVVFSQVADKFGRKKLLFTGVTGVFFVSLLLGFVSDYRIFLVLKFLCGILVMCCYIPGTSMQVECVAIELRAFTSFPGIVVYLIAVNLVGLIAYLLHGYDWRILQLTYAIASLPPVFLAFFLDETLPWLIQNSRFSEAERLIRKACRWNGKDFEDLVEKCLKRQKKVLLQNHNGNNIENPALDTKYNILDIPRNRNARVVTCIMGFVWIMVELTYYSIYLMSTSLAGDPYINYFLVGCAEFPTLVIPYLGANRFGRKKTLIFVHLASAVFLVLSSISAHLAPPDLSVLQTVFTTIGQMCVTCNFWLLYIYTPELYPTNVRTVGLGISSCSGKLGAVFSPLVTILVNKIAWLPAALFSVGCLISASFIMILSETKNKELPATFEDLNSLFKKDNRRGDVCIKDKCLRNQIDGMVVNARI